MQRASSSTASACPRASSLRPTRPTEDSLAVHPQPRTPSTSGNRSPKPSCGLAPTPRNLRRAAQVSISNRPSISNGTPIGCRHRSQTASQIRWTQPRVQTKVTQVSRSPGDLHPENLYTITPRSLATMASHRSRTWHFVRLFVVQVVIFGCAASLIRPTSERRRIPLIGGTALAPGQPWGFVDVGLPSENLRMTVVTTGDYEHLSFPMPGRGAESPLVVADPGRIGVGTWTGNEMIIVYSSWSAPVASDRTEYVEETKKQVERDLTSLRATNIQDISEEYQKRLDFWPGYVLAFTYKTQDLLRKEGVRDYLAVFAFVIAPGPKADSYVLHDLSYIRMEKAGATNRFDDFAATLRSIELPAASGSNAEGSEAPRQ